jgi:hypothetical protein
MNDEVLADQVDCYRRRAGEYDVTAYGDVAAARAYLLLMRRPRRGRSLATACGRRVSASRWLTGGFSVRNGQSCALIRQPVAPVYSVACAFAGQAHERAAATEVGKGRAGRREGAENRWCYRVPASDNRVS